ncbi:MAG: antitoxin Xre/MbcA/ParS toxin-binding domain-containing protein [Pseudodesulfovibrio sp.]
MSLCRQSSPESRYVPAPLVDLSESSERERLSPSAVKAYFNILDKWDVGEEVGRELLGGVSRGQFYNLKKHGAVRPLDQDKLQRVSCLVGIFKALNLLYSEKLADTWVSLPNKNRIFRGASPIDFMAIGGIPSMLMVRRLLDARRGGV